jgi:hypothetical protein
MHIYELRCPDNDNDTPIMRQFRAEDPCQALLIAQEQPSGSRLELWEDGEMVCELTRIPVDGQDIWVVGQPE